MRELMALADRVALSASPALIQGESGTGKDFLAHYLHYRGPRRAGPLLKVHCPAIPEDLLESELFGHERGAFTDARQAKAGKVELAQGGTLFFDQIGDLSPALQAKLLRVVEEKAFERLGGTRTLRVDVRFVAAAGADLPRAVEAGSFREDLYHRLCVLPLEIPPLRERREDIAPLAELFLRRDREGRAARRLAARTRELLCGYHWPGNVRELKAVMERAGLLADGEEIPPAALPPGLLDQPDALWRGRGQRRPSLRDVEEAYVRFVLEQAGGNQTRAAAILGISRKALWEKRRRYGIG
jgi:two-component system NtrC family response regulator